MYGYIRQGQRTALTREVIGGVPFWVLTTGRGWQRLRVRSMLRRLARHGVRTAVFEDDTWQTAAARYGIHPVPVGALRLAKLEEMLDCVCPALSGKTVRLAVGENGGTARQAAQVLAKRARYIELTPPGQTALAQWLLARYGVAAGSGGQQAAAVVWCGQRIGGTCHISGGRLCGTAGGAVRGGGVGTVAGVGAAIGGAVGGRRMGGI